MKIKEFTNLKKKSVAEGIARGPKEKKLYELLSSWLHFISFKTVKVPNDAIDANGRQILTSMQKHYLGPVVNGMAMGEILKGDLWQNPKVIPHLLKYVYQGIPFIEERIKKFVKPSEQQNYLSAIEKIKQLYKESVAQYSQGQQGVTERLNELSNELLGRYKKAAGADAREADKRGDYKRGNKRFSGILKATDKEFKNALRGVKEDSKPDLPGAAPGIKIMTPQEFASTAGNEVGEAINNRDRISKGKPPGYEVSQKYFDKAMASMFGGKDSDEQKNKAASRYFKIKTVTDPDLVDAKNLVGEETKLPAPTRELKGQELTDYLDRIRGKEKKKTDKYKLPYIHRSDVVKYYNADGKKYDTDAIKAAISQRPAKLLKKNEKMRHSDGTYEQFFNVGFAALVGLALDESTGELVVVNTCPGAGSCKIDCFAMKGGKVQFAPAWMSDSRILTYLLNDPDGFFAQLKSEILAQVKAGAKKDIKVSIRWHDAGDFFSPEYVDMAFKLARELPMVDFYAYTKIGGVAVGDKPANFMINWSEGAHPSQERIVKKDDAGLEATKNSRIVPSKLFYDLLVKDEKKNLVKGPEGQWQVIPEKLQELKQRLAREYGISANSILSYSEWDSKVRGRDKTPLKYNVIIAPGEPDITAKDPGVLSTLLLKH